MCALPLGVTPRDMAVVQELCGVFAALSMMQVRWLVQCAAPFSPFYQCWRRELAELCGTAW
jgi:hypothetical protein